MIVMRWGSTCHDVPQLGCHTVALEAYGAGLPVHPRRSGQHVAREVEGRQLGPYPWLSTPLFMASRLRNLEVDTQADLSTAYAPCCDPAISKMIVDSVADPCCVRLTGT